MADPVCPVCGKAADARFAPFCSVRCQQIDLGRWLKGDYVIPSGGSEPDPAPPQAPESEEE